jgi:hypothetical protein
VSTDALLIALAETRHRRDIADQYIRTLLAFARELSSARPYSLTELAEAAGIAASAVPTAYTTADVHRAATMPVPPGLTHSGTTGTPSPPCATTPDLWRSPTNTGTGASGRRHKPAPGAPSP